MVSSNRSRPHIGDKSPNGLLTLSREEIPLDIKIALIKNELQPYLNTRYLLNTRYAVIEALPTKDEATKTTRLDAIETELIDIESYITAYEKILADLSDDASTPDA